jgi:glycosyltransferase involved in cell wall biosynthesis
MAEAGCPVTVFSVTNGNDGGSVRLDSRVRLSQETAAGWGGFRHSPWLWRQAEAAGIDLVHSHGLWTDVNRLAGAIARRRGLPHLLAPCGMLAPGALRHHWWKKVPVRFWFQDRALREAQCLHAKSFKEYEHIRRFGLRNPVAVIPNPISMPPLADRMSREEFCGSHQLPANRKIVLFLGRLHPVKGLPRLLHAWGSIQTEREESGKRRLAHETEVGGRRTEMKTGSKKDWTLVLAGPDEGGHQRRLDSLASQLGCQKSVLFAGELNEKQKWAALAAADLFVMPSDFENFGNAIVEAMSCAVPVITTTGTPWEELNTTGAGWCVAPTAEKLAGALSEALALSDDQRRAMGNRALQLAERFRPGRIGEDLIQVYEWLLGTRAKPECVVS